MTIRSTARLTQLLGVALAVAAIALASQVEVPLEPVPLTLQTLAVVLTGFVLGPPLGFAATAIWLAAGAAGLPLFAGWEGGIEHLTGPTAGYLLSFPFAAAVAGFGAECAGPRNRTLRLLLWAVAAHLVTLAVGGGWLATQIGTDAALEKGVLPFLPGAVAKSGGAVFLAKLIDAAVPRRR